MISSFKKLWRDTGGNALVIAGASLPLMIGAAGLATDTIQWTLWKRQLQRTADSAAIAAVYGQIAGETRDAAVSRDMDHNSHVATTPSITYLTPAAPYATDANAVRLRLSYSKMLSFSSFFLSSPPIITADATATVIPSGDYCVVSLEDEAETGIDATGSTVVNMGCGMITNSTSDAAAVATGNSSVTASPMAAVGQIPASDNWGAGTVLQPFTLKQADPFASKTIPSFSGCGSVPSMQNHQATAITNPSGIRCFTGNMTIQGHVTLDPGTYILDGGSLSMTNSNSSLTCSGCTIILTNSSTASDATIGGVNLSGGRLNMTAPTGGDYAGMLFFQDRRADENNPNKINGNSASTLEGAMYFPRGTMEFTGTAGMTTTCLLIASKRVVFKGNSAIDNDCPASWLDSFRGRRVRLVA